MNWPTSSIGPPCTANVGTLMKFEALVQVTPVKNLEEEFAALDKSEDGRLSGKEMGGLEAYDKNQDGCVPLEEFLAGR